MSIKNPVVNKIFNDLEELHNFCRTEGYPFNEADLYKSDARVWQAFQKYKNWIRLSIDNLPKYRFSNSLFKT